MLAASSTEQRNAALELIAKRLGERSGEILEANKIDVDAAIEADTDSALIDRLTLTPERIEGIAEGVRAVIGLDDPVGETLDRRTLPNGVELHKIRVPLGVVAVVYEARPNVTVDCAALTIKSGNAIVLRGSSHAQHSNAILAVIVRDAVAEAGLPIDSVTFLGGGGRDELAELARMEGVVDLIIPRGGEGLKNALKAVAEVPVLYAAAGNNHVYVDASADLAMAEAIAVNSKVQRPGVCNAAETLLVHRDIADEFLPMILAALHESSVELVGDQASRDQAQSIPVGEATEDDWLTEYHALKMAVKVVDSAEQAIEHINHYGTGHSDAIVTSDEAVAKTFTTLVDSACVYVNASTRFTDGFEFGMGAEIGNSTQKLHARGPIALRELATMKYVMHGTGQIRS